jgi:hypothetical protein
MNRANRNASAAPNVSILRGVQQGLRGSTPAWFVMFSFRQLEQVRARGPLPQAKRAQSRSRGRAIRTSASSKMR